MESERCLRRHLSEILASVWLIPSAFGWGALVYRAFYVQIGTLADKYGIRRFCIKTIVPISQRHQPKLES